MTNLMLLLMEAFHFTPDDLAANREGKVTQSQLDRFEFEKRNDFGVVIILSLLVLPCGVCTLLTSDQSERFSTFLASCLLFAFICLLVVVTWIDIRKLFKQESLDRQVTHYEGRVKLTAERHKAMIYTLHLVDTDKRAFTITPKQHEQLNATFQQQSVRLRVYVLKHSRHIVSAEVV